MRLTYPSREEAMQHRSELQEAVAAVRKGEEPERDALAWPAGLDRTLLRGLPLPTHTRHCLLRSGLMEGDNRFTVAEIGRTPGVGPTTVRNLLIGIDEFLREYGDTFDGRPGPVEVAAMRLQRVVERLTQAGWAIIEPIRDAVVHPLCWFGSPGCFEFGRGAWFSAMHRQLWLGKSWCVFEIALF